MAAAALHPALGCTSREPDSQARTAVEAGWKVRPFDLDQVALGEGLFQQKRDRMLHYARSYGGTDDVFAVPDRLLATFRVNAGLDDRGADSAGGWETHTGYLRGHYAGHFMSLLAQAWAGTGDEVYKEKLDYMVDALAKCQEALAAAAALPTPRVPGRHGTAVRLSGSPLGQAEHVRLPSGSLGLARDATIATWLKLALYEAESLPDPRQTPAELVNGSAVFDFGSPSPEYAESPQAYMFLTVRASNENPVPRFAITTRGVEGEQSLVGKDPLPVGEWVHLAVTLSSRAGTLYVDGQAVATSSEITLAPSDLGERESNWIGRRQFPQRSVSYLNATLDELLIFDRALSAEEVAALMESPDGASGEDVVAWYRFDEAPGATVGDSSGHGRDGEVIGPTDGRRHPGFLSAYPETQFVRLEEFATYGGSRGIWAPYYTLHKIMAGLIDAHVLAGNDTALSVLTGIGDWVDSRTAPLAQEQLDRMWDIYIAGEYGGINESLATLNALVPEKSEYLDAARRYVNRNVYRPVAADEDVLDGRHANQHVPQFTGYLRTYERGQDESYLAAARNFWDMIVPGRIYSHGGIGVGEMFRGKATAGSLFAEPNHAETCPLYNMLKLSRNLFFHDPEAKYMDYYELGLFNQMAGSRRDVDSAVSPEVTYFVPVRPGGRRSYGNVGTCCGGTGLESHTKYQDSIYFRSADDSALWVNLYIASELTWTEREVTITQTTRFPEEGASTLIVDGSGDFDVKLRVPAWAGNGFEVAINGERQELAPTPGTYLTLSRRWSPGDRIDVTIPLRFRVTSTIDDPSVQSIYYGPILLAVQAGEVGEDLDTGLIPVSFYPYLKLDGDLAAAMSPGEEPLHFTTDGLELAPFYVADPGPPAMLHPPEPHEDGVPGRPYHLYVKRHEPRIVFGSVDAEVPNPAGEDGRTFLDVLWAEAPFPDHRAFLRAVERLATEWQSASVFSPEQREAIVDAAGRAEEDLRPAPTAGLGLQHGLLSLDATSFALDLVRASQTVASLRPKRADGFDFVPADWLERRSANGFFHLGDLTLRLRREGAEDWESYSTAADRQAVKELPAARPTLAAADLAPTLPPDIPLAVRRFWEDREGKLLLRFELENRSSRPVEIGALGMPMIFNNILSDRSLDEAHAVCSFQDPYVGAEAGYVQVTRLTGLGPTLVVVPLRGTSLEAYNPLLSDPTPRGVTFEGFYEWVAHSRALADVEWGAAEPWNPPTSATLAPGERRSYGVAFLLADGVRAVEPRLAADGRPVAVGIPGYVLPTDLEARLYLKTDSAIESLRVEPEDALTVAAAGRTPGGWQAFDVRGRKWGRARVTVRYATGIEQTIHYKVIKPAMEVVTDLGRFLTTEQWFEAPEDPFGRSPSIITYDYEERRPVTEDDRAWIAGLGDEGGSGSWLAATMKQLIRPSSAELQKIQRFVDEVLWGGLQYAEGERAYGVRKSLFFYEPDSMPAGTYSDAVSYGGWSSWNREESSSVIRSYNYPHVTALHWVFYRLARNRVGLVTNHPWDWYLERSYGTAMAMVRYAPQHARFGQMEGTVFVLLLEDLQREGWTEQARALEAAMKERADLWRSLPYPFGSEMPWDSTGQEEVYAWSKHFGYEEKARVTLNAILAYMPTVPHWGYNGSARRYWDFQYAGKLRRIERQLHHYGSGLNAIPVLAEYRQHPDDLYLLRVGYGGLMGSIANVNRDGFGPSAFHAYPDTLRIDGISGDYGPGFFGHTVSTGVYLAHDPELGWVAFGGNLTVEGDAAEGDAVHLRPLDSVRSRVYLAPLGLWLTLEAGAFEEVEIRGEEVRLRLAPADPYSPAGRLRIERPAPSNEPRRYRPHGDLAMERGAYVIPLGRNATDVVLVPSGSGN